MSSGKYLSLEEAREHALLERFCKVHPSEAERDRFMRLLEEMAKGTLEGEETSRRDRVGGSTGTRIPRDT